jgi:hypothetical protein
MQGRAAGLWDSIGENALPELPPGHIPDDALPGSRLKVSLQNGVEIPKCDSTPSELVPIAIFGQKGLATEATATVHNRLFEHLVFERVKRVVVDEDADGSLSRQQMGHVLDHVPQVRYRGTRG